MNCNICKDTKLIESSIFDSENDYVECPYCSDKPEYKAFQERHFKTLKFIKESYPNIIKKIKINE